MPKIITNISQNNIVFFCTNLGLKMIEEGGDLAIENSLVAILKKYYNFCVSSADKKILLKVLSNNFLNQVLIFLRRIQRLCRHFLALWETNA